VLVDRRAYDAAGALPDLADLDLAVFELCRQLRAHGGEIVVVPSAIVVDHRPVANHRALMHPFSAGTAAWHAYVEDHGPALMREASPLPEGCLRIAVTIAAPSEKIAPRWGDWHLAEAFAAALRREGHSVRIQTADHADDLAGRACDVHCVIRGLLRVRRTAGQAHVLWIISHPESVDSTECEAADLILVASVRFADALRARTSTPVEVLLQATDPHRFRPMEPEAKHTHDVAIVAKSRDVFRSAVADAVAAGLRPAIYGSGWARFVDPALVVREYVPNEELPIVYSSVGVLLNDHWETMREWGFVSNRLFDALACGTPVISDDLPEIDALFARTVLTYDDADQLRELVAATLADRPAARARAARGRELVVGQHTFDHRARELVAALRRHGLG
jgi:glycosyltransferase involved in cell wall biosynthesis